MLDKALVVVFQQYRLLRLRVQL